jgi:hypothetical protein
MTFRRQPTAASRRVHATLEAPMSNVASATSPLRPSSPWVLVRSLFDHGRLHFYADYVRGRCLKTTVDIDKDGKIVVETVNRGEAATRWISKLQGKKVLSLVDDARGPAAPGA